MAEKYTDLLELPPRSSKLNQLLKNCLVVYTALIINAIILNTKSMNRQTGKEMRVNKVRYHVYQQLKADEHKTDFSMTLPHFDERWNTVYDMMPWGTLKMDIELFPFFICRHNY